MSTAAPKKSNKSEGKAKKRKDSAPKRTSKPKDAEAKKEGKKRDRRMNAKNADRYELYQRAVNSPEADVLFIEKVYELGQKHLEATVGALAAGLPIFEVQFHAGEEFTVTELQKADPSKRKTH